MKQTYGQIQVRSNYSSSYLFALIQQRGTGSIPVMTTINLDNQSYKIVEVSLYEKRLLRSPSVCNTNLVKAT